MPNAVSTMAPLCRETPVFEPAGLPASRVAADGSPTALVAMSRPLMAQPVERKPPASLIVTSMKPSLLVSWAESNSSAVNWPVLRNDTHKQISLVKLRSRRVDRHDAMRDFCRFVL